MIRQELPAAPLVPAWVRTAVAKAVTLGNRSALAAAQLFTLLTAGAAALATAKADTTAPAVSSRTQAFGVAKIVITYDGELHPSFVPVATDFAITSPARTVTAADVVGATVVVSYSGDVLVTADSPEIAYTQNTSVGHRDWGNNLAATFAAAAVTVASE